MALVNRGLLHTFLTRPDEVYYPTTAFEPLAQTHALITERSHRVRTLLCRTGPPRKTFPGIAGSRTQASGFAILILGLGRIQLS